MVFLLRNKTTAIKKAQNMCFGLFVRVIGLEPTRLAAPDPKSGTSTNFAIPAKL
jgi:hypothetical protein